MPDAEDTQPGIGLTGLVLVLAGAALAGFLVAGVGAAVGPRARSESRSRAWADT